MELAPCPKIPAVVLIGSYFSRAINNQSETLHGSVYYAISTKFSLLRSTFLAKDKNGREKRNKRFCLNILRASKTFYRKLTRDILPIVSKYMAEMNGDVYKGSQANSKHGTILTMK